MGDDMDTILAKPASQWSSSEANAVYKAMKEHGKDTVKARMEQVRAANE